MVFQYHHGDHLASEEVVRPCIVLDFNGACLNQDALNTLVDLLHNSATDYDVVDVHLKRISRQVIPQIIIATDG